MKVKLDCDIECKSVKFTFSGSPYDSHTMEVVGSISTNGYVSPVGNEMIFHVPLDRELFRHLKKIVEDRMGEVVMNKKTEIEKYGEVESE